MIRLHSFLSKKRHERNMLTEWLAYVKNQDQTTKALNKISPPLLKNNSILCLYSIPLLYVLFDVQNEEQNKDRNLIVGKILSCF